MTDRNIHRITVSPPSPAKPRGLSPWSSPFREESARELGGNRFTIGGNTAVPPPAPWSDPQSDLSLVRAK